MFAQLFHSAKRILNPALSGQQETPSQTPEASLKRDIDITMVVTRRGTGTDTPRSEAATPRSSTRKRVGKRELEGLETPTASAAKRLKKAAPRKKEIEETPEPDAPRPELAHESSETIDTAAPDQADSGSPEAGKLPVRGRAESPKVVVAHKPSPPPVEESVTDDEATPTQDNDFHTPEGQASSVYATPATRRKHEASPTPRAHVAQDPTPATARKNGRKTKTQTADEPTPRALKFTDEVPSSTQESVQTPVASPEAAPQPKKAHVRFGSEEPAVDNALLEALQPTQDQSAMEVDQDEDDNDDDASDSDEAPEVVTTASAASKLKLAEADAARARARALQVQQEKERSKREAREQRLATERAEKLKREAKKAQKLAKQMAQQSPPPPQKQHSLPIDPRNLPALLPDSLLSAIDDTRPPTPPPERRGKTEEQLRNEKLNHHIKFLERSEKPAKDVKKGRLHVAVLDSQNRVLPPKVNRDTRNVREHWLKGRQVEKKGKGKGKFQHKRVERRAYGGGGFLKGED